MNSTQSCSDEIWPRWSFRGVFHININCVLGLFLIFLKGTDVGASIELVSGM